MTGAFLAAAGIVLVLNAIGLSINTSMGGTRSDHDDGSGVIGAAGVVLTLAGAAILATEALS